MDNRNRRLVAQAMVKVKALDMAKSVKARAMVAATREQLRATIQDQRLPLNMDLAALHMNGRNLAQRPDTAALTIRDMARALMADLSPPKTPMAGKDEMIRQAMVEKMRALGMDSTTPALASGKKTRAPGMAINRKTKDMAARLRTALLATVEQTKIDPSTNNSSPTASNRPTVLAEIMIARLPMADRRSMQATVKREARADMAEDMGLEMKTATGLAKSMVMDEIKQSADFEKFGYLWTNRYEKAVE